MLSLYAQYIKERVGRGIVETDEGFATFDYLSDDIVYIMDLFVIPEKRKSRVASSLADTVCAQAAKDGKKWLLGSVDTLAKGAETSEKVLLGYGMKPYKKNESIIFYIKPIGE